MPTENPWKDPSKIWAWSSYRPFVVKEVYSSTVSTLANFPSKRMMPYSARRATGDPAWGTCVDSGSRSAQSFRGLSDL